MALNCEESAWFKRSGTLAAISFLSAVCKFLYSKKFSKEEIINSIYAFDINNDALIIAKFIICAELKLSEELTKKFLNNNNFKNIDSLLMDYPDQNLFSEKSLDIKFDYIVTNPPYERLKPDGYSVEGKNDIENYIKKIKSKRYDLSLSGNLNLYKLFLEKILRIIENRDRPTICGIVLKIDIQPGKSVGEITYKVNTDKNG